MNPELKPLLITPGLSSNLDASPERLTQEECRFIRNILSDQRGIYSHGLYSLRKYSQSFMQDIAYDMQVINYNSFYHIIALSTDYNDGWNVLRVSKPYSLEKLLDSTTQLEFPLNLSESGVFTNKISTAVFDKAFYVCGLKTLDTRNNQGHTVLRYDESHQDMMLLNYDNVEIFQPACITKHRERLVIGGFVDKPSIFYWSRLFNPEKFDPEDFAGTGHNESILTMISFHNYLFLFTNKNVWRFDGPPSASLIRILDKGCPSGRVATWRGLIFFIDEFGHLNALTGEAEKSTPITLNRVNKWVDNMNLQASPDVVLDKTLGTPLWNGVTLQDNIEIADYRENRIHIKGIADNKYPSSVNTLHIEDGGAQILYNKEYQSPQGATPYYLHRIGEKDDDNVLANQVVIIHPYWLDNPNHKYELGYAWDIPFSPDCPITFNEIAMPVTIWNDGLYSTGTFAMQVWSIRFKNIIRNGNVNTDIETVKMIGESDTKTRGTGTTIYDHTEHSIKFEFPHPIRMSVSQTDAENVQGYLFKLVRKSGTKWIDVKIYINKSYFAYFYRNEAHIRQEMPPDNSYTYLSSRNIWTWGQCMVMATNQLDYTDENIVASTEFVSDITPTYIEIVANASMGEGEYQEQSPYSVAQFLLRYYLNYNDPNGKQVTGERWFVGDESGTVKTLFKEYLKLARQVTGATHRFEIHLGSKKYNTGCRTDQTELERFTIKAFVGQDKWKDINLFSTDNGVFMVGKNIKELTYQSNDSEVLMFNGNINFFTIEELKSKETPIHRLDAMASVNNDLIIGRYTDKLVSPEQRIAKYFLMKTLSPDTLEKTLPENFVTELDDGEFRTGVIRSKNLIGIDSPLLLRNIELRLGVTKEILGTGLLIGDGVDAKFIIRIIKPEYIDIDIDNIPDGGILYEEELVYPITKGGVRLTDYGYFTKSLSLNTIAKEFFIDIIVRNMTIQPSTIYYQPKGRIVESKEQS